MKLLSFLAGVATGVLLTRSMASGGSTLAPARGRSLRADPSTDDRDDATLAPPRTDAELRDRIRARIARTIANPETIQVDVADGCVTLRGQVQARDSILLMAEVEIAAGVKSVKNELDIPGSLDDVAPPMTRDKPAVRAAERATSHMS
jgi:osmotically-inducible protein OsmY